MTARNDGGPAFPAPFGEDAWMLGMTLRDYLAAKAMQGYCSREGSIEQEAESIASDAYMVADAMIAARS